MSTIVPRWIKVDVFEFADEVRVSLDEVRANGSRLAGPTVTMAQYLTMKNQTVTLAAK